MTQLEWMEGIPEEEGYYFDFYNGWVRMKHFVTFLDDDRLVDKRTGEPPKEDHVYSERIEVPKPLPSYWTPPWQGKTIHHA